MMLASQLSASLRFLIAMLMMTALSACSGNNNMADLQQHIINITLRPGGEIEPMPEFPPYAAFTYSAASMRSPFDVPLTVLMRETGQDAGMIMPDDNRPREPLEEFALASLTMVGMLYRDNRYVGLVRDETGAVHRVPVGAYMGRNHGRVHSVTPTQIDLVEIVPSGDGGWVERPRTLALQR
jgi:type IV pilus assembly protein PilP